MSKLGLFHHPTLSDSIAAYSAAFHDGPEFSTWVSRFANHGDFPHWQQALDRLPTVAATQQPDERRLSLRGTLDAQQRAQLLSALAACKPWRKGPWDFFGTEVTTEWRSDWKWARLQPHLPPLTGQRILDVGSGNGFFGWRLLHGGAAQVLGVDPTVLFCVQHLLVNHFMHSDRHWVLPLTFEELPPMQFDGVLSLGVVYHRRQPQQHLERLFAFTKPGGWLALESLTVATGASLHPAPQTRYARMRNVWCVPNHDDLLHWLTAAGFVDAQVVDQCRTLPAEQHSTPWMTFESLAAALDPTDAEKTVEGFPAPRRTLVLARRPPLQA